MDYTIREIQKQEYPLLDNFLYEAIFIPEGTEPPPKTIITSPELQIYIEHFGGLKDDWGLVAEIDEKVVGAVWVRIMNDYGLSTIIPHLWQSPFIKNIGDWVSEQP